MKLQLSLIFILLSTFVFTQESPISSCNPPSARTFLHGNEIRAMLSNSGDLFWDGSEALFEVPFGEGVHSIFAQGLWMGGIDQGGNLKLAAQTYGVPGTVDYWAGPLDETGSISTESCEDWDRIWCVSRYEILTHIEDFEEDGTIDTPIPSLMQWPGIGNPHFEEIFGFSLPDDYQGFAPFFDTNADGFYDPLDGDYPIVQQIDIIPEQICWNVINDNGNIHASSNGDPLQMEVQMTSWALSCPDNNQLNNTIFLSYKLINKSIEPIDSLYVGIWNDFDLGCYTDDYIGYHEATNSVFVYNQDNIDGENDGSCPFGIPSYGENPPVQAATFLSHPLAYGMYYNNGGLGSIPPTTDPNTALEYYYLLSGRWRDGSPLQTGGDGYLEGTEPTNIAFPGDPNNSDEWSALSTGLLEGDQRTVSSIYIGKMLPGVVQTVDIAYSFFREPGANFLENVTAMYEGLAELQVWYSSNFSTACTPADLCTDDCVWAGDLNADGIANYCDLIAVQPYINSSGNTRAAPYNWSPKDAEDWADTQANNANLKHQDANGNGVITYDDCILTDIHYGLTTPDYIPAPVVIFESDVRGLSVEGALSTLENIEPGSTILARINIEGYPPLLSLGFIMEYDPQYFESIAYFGSDGFHIEKLELKERFPLQGEMHYAKIAPTDDEYITDGVVTLIQIRTKDDFQDLPSGSTTIRFINTKGFNTEGEEVIIESINQEITFDGVSSTEEFYAGEDPIKVYPNPANQHILVQSDRSLITPIQLYSTTGQLVQNISGNGNTIQEIDVSDLARGLYLLRVATDEGVVVKRFIKQ
jgi:hypothetical protein